MLTPPDTEVFEIMHTINHLYRSQQFRALVGDARELGPIEFRALAFIARHAGCTQGDLVEHSGRDKGQIARLLAGLRKSGLVVAHADSVDRRSTLLRLSQAGEDVFKEIQEQGEQLAKIALVGMPPEDRALLHDLLRRVRSSLVANRI